MLDVIKNLKGRQASTLTTYAYKYNYAEQAGINITDPEDITIKKLEMLRSTLKWNRILDILTIVLTLRSELELPRKLLQEYKRKVVDDKPTVELENMPNMRSINNFLNDLYENKTFKDFIINYLIINLNTRNADLDLTITKEKQTDTSKNYLVINKASVLYVRNKYKTVGSYGVKTHELTDKKFYNACLKLLGTDNNKELLTSSNKNQEIQWATFNKLGSGRMFKIALKNVGVSEAKNNIEKMGANRGTDTKTLLKYYA